MEQSDVTLLPLVVVTVIVFLVPIMVLRIPRLTVPIVVGEIIAGIAVGPSGLNIVQEDLVLTILAELGFVYLMFLSGLEIDFSRLREVSQDAKESSAGVLANPLGIGSATFLLSLLIAGTCSLLLREVDLIQDPYLMALILSTTSVGVVVPVLRERGLSRGSLGQSIIVSAVFADFLTIVLISLYVLARTEGVGGEFLFVLLLFAAFLAAYRIAELFRQHLPAERILEELSSATSQLKLRGSFALALIFVALAETLGVENILGAFLAGVVISMLSSQHETMLREKQDAIGYGFLIPIFFVMVGVGFDLPALLESGRALALVPVLVGVAFAVKFVPALAFRLLFSWRESFAAGALLSARLSLIIAASAIGLELGIISDAINSAIILVALISVTLSPIAFNRIMPAAAEEPDRVIIFGSDPAAEVLATRLQDHGTDVHLEVGDVGGHGFEGAVSTDELRRVRDALQNAGIERARALVVMVGHAEEQLRICRIAREHYGVEHVFAWVSEPTMIEQYRQLDVHVVNPGYTAVMVMESMILNPVVFQGLAAIDGQRGIRTVELRNRLYIGRRVREVNLSESDFSILYVQRDGVTFVPDDSTTHEIVLREGDVLTIVGDGDRVDDITTLFSDTSPRQV